MYAKKSSSFVQAFGPGRKAIRDDRGTALVIILSAVVLISVLVAVFLSQATLNRQISSSSAGSYRADIVAQLGLDTVVGDLRNEIAAGSTTYTQNGVKIYQPTTNFTVVPSRVADGGYPNVIKRSAGGTNFWKGTGLSSDGPIRSATGNSTTNVSINGRSIQLARWNAPYLLGTNLPVGFSSPDWVLVSRRGAFTSAGALPSLAVLSDSAASNTNFVIGRYAYMIYNEGGLLDVTVAGFPNGMDAAFKAKRGLLPQVDLALIPGVLDASALVLWRNKGSSLTPSTYREYALGATNGFATVSPGDQTFVSRQDFINYAKAHSTEITMEALQYLGTSSVEANAPSFFPAPARPRVGSAYPKHGEDDSYNPSLVNTRVTESFLRSDGSTALVGEPLIKQRFPLSRLALIKPDPTTTDAVKIFQHFGLAWSPSDSTWIYRNNANEILTLDQVALEKREPDFFELLQAGILLGSLGQRVKDNTSALASFDENIFYQVIQIGANLIDQYDENSFPTIISFNGTDFAGVENIPYISRVFTVGYRFHDSSYAAALYPKIGVWYQPEIWNPHGQAAMLPHTNGPSLFRFRTIGDQVRVQYFENGALRVETPYVDLKNTSQGITFPTTSAYSYAKPTIPSPATGAAASSPNDRVVDAGNDFLGVCAGIINNAPLNNPGAISYTGPSHVPWVTHELQYWDGAKWVTYNWMRYVLQSHTVNQQGVYEQSFMQSVFFPSRYGLICYLGRADPRSDRFGAWRSDFTVDAAMKANISTSENDTIRPGVAAGDTQALHPSSGWTYGGPNAAIGFLSENKDSSPTHYADTDGVVRAADGAYTIGNTFGGGYAMGTDAFSVANSRPTILNRPFRSVGEMSYASRGMPWKQIDFFSDKSADGALLDLFCLTESAEVVQHGKIDLNTRQQPVLNAILNGAAVEDSTVTVLNATRAGALATSLVDLTSGSGGPLLNKADLVTRWISILPADSTAGNNTIKRRREAALRALSDVGNTRTWNVMIDIIAQSGRFPTNATNLNTFSVEGERRFWLHVAIDRYTGKVISTSLEPVYE